MLSLPLKSEATSCISFSLWGFNEASQTDPVTKNPLSLHSWRHLVSSASFLEHVCTAAPNPASSSTTAWLKKPIKIQRKKKKNPNRFFISQNSKKKLKFIKNKIKNEIHKVWNWRRKRRKREDPIPRVPPVTRAFIPLSDHFEALRLLSDSAFAIFAVCQKSNFYFLSSFIYQSWLYMYNWAAKQLNVCFVLPR